MESHCTAVHLSVMLNSEVTFLLFVFVFFSIRPFQSFWLARLCLHIACVLFLHTMTLTA